MEERAFAKEDSLAPSARHESDRVRENELQSSLSSFSQMVRSFRQPRSQVRPTFLGTEGAVGSFDRKDERHGDAVLDEMRPAGVLQGLQLQRPPSLLRAARRRARKSHQRHGRRSPLPSVEEETVRMNEGIQQLRDVGVL